MTANKKPIAYPVRVHVHTAGTWRAEQLAQTLLAIDRIATRVGIASYISQTCEAYDYVIRHMGMFGLMGKAPDEWEKPTTPTDVELRTDLAAFASTLRNVGVEVKVTHLGVHFLFLVEDLYELLPVSSRAEVEKIHMSSPGSWVLLLTGALKSEGAVTLLGKIFDSIFFRESTKRSKVAEARQKEAEADIAEAKARAENVSAHSHELSLRQQETDMFLDYAVAVDSLVSALRNAGFEHTQIQRIVQDRLTADIDLLARHKSMGLIESLDMEPV